MSRTRIDRLVALVIIIAIMLGGWLLVVEPRLSQTRTLQAQQRAITAITAVESTKLENLKHQFQNLTVLQGQLSELQARFPTEPDIAAFISAIAGAAAASGVTVTSVVPGAPAAYVPVAGSAAAGAAPRAGELFTIPLSIAATGNPAGANGFIDALQRTNRLFIVSSVGSSTGATGQTVVAVTGYIFVARPPGVAR